jgi:hypothetical protein
VAIVSAVEVILMDGQVPDVQIGAILTINQLTRLLSLAMRFAARRGGFGVWLGSPRG